MSDQSSQRGPRESPADVPVIDLGVMAYDAAYQEQLHAHQRVLDARGRAAEGSARASAAARGSARAGVILMVEHPPVITLTRRARPSLLASPDALRREGVSVEETDRGGDATYHGPGQLVAYAILDLNALGLGLHGYMRMLEAAVIEACGEFGVLAQRDEPDVPGAAPATGVWTRLPDGRLAKLCAMGVRVRRWVSMHGLALNVDPNLGHFSLIVPCGLVGRPVTSLRAILGDACPPMALVKSALAGALRRAIDDRLGALGGDPGGAPADAAGPS